MDLKSLFATNFAPVVADLQSELPASPVDGGSGPESLRQPEDPAAVTDPPSFSAGNSGDVEQTSPQISGQIVFDRQVLRRVPEEVERHLVSRHLVGSDLPVLQEISSVE